MSTRPGPTDASASTSFSPTSSSPPSPVFSSLRAKRRSAAMPELALFDAVSESDATRKRKRVPPSEPVTLVNRRLGDCADEYKRHLRVNDCCLHSAALVLAIGASEDFFKDPDCTPLRHMLALPDTAEQLARALALVDKIDQCIGAGEMLVARNKAQIRACQQEDANGSVTSLLLVRQSKLDAMLGTLRLVRMLKTTRAMRPTAHVQLLNGVYKEMSTNFCEAFDPERYGVLTEPAAAGEECHVCREPFDSTLSHRARLALTCCDHKQAICVGCMMEHAYTRTNVARKTFFQCPFCNHEHAIEPPAAPEPPS